MGAGNVATGRPQLLKQAQAHLKDAERLLDADPTDEWIKMSVELLRDEVESLRQILKRYDEQQLAVGQRR
jgi:hypothetical protein